MNGFVDRIKSSGALGEPGSVARVLSLLAAVYGIHVITQNGGDFIQVDITASFL